MLLTTLAGPGLHRGLELGRGHARGVAEAATALKTDLAATGHSPTALARRMAASPLAHVAADLTPDLWAEVTATASASRVDLTDVLLLTFLDEVWAMTHSSGCSAVARTVDPRPGTPPIPATTEIGQTMDLPEWALGRGLVLRIVPEHAPAALLMTYPGMLGLCGANESGLGVAVTALPHLPSSEEGLGVAFIVRHLLTLSTLAQAEEFLTTVPHAVAQAYTIAASDGIGTFEADPTGAERVDHPGTTVAIHTNHALSPGRSAHGRPPSLSSRERYDALVRGLEQHRPLAEVLASDVLVDGQVWGDPHTTFGAFRAVGSEPVVRFIDGADLRAGKREWSRFAFR
jgi:isopenicillin-N N-acyltransferase-like protein